MRHHNQNRKFGRASDARQAFIRSLTRALVQHGKIKTTEARAKAVRPFVEKLVTTARPGDLHARRLVVARLGAGLSADKLCREVAPKYKDRQGGYTRITKLPARLGDGSKMAIIEFI